MFKFSYEDDLDNLVYCEKCDCKHYPPECNKKKPVISHFDDNWLGDIHDSRSGSIPKEKR